MSNQVRAIVERRKVGNSTKKAVLAYLADRASDDGSGIWTSKSHIAADTEFSTRGVQKAMTELEADGIIAKVGTRPHARGFTYLYSIDIEAVKRLPSTRSEDADLTGEPRSGVNHVHPKTRTTFTPRGEPRSPKPSIEPSIEPSNSARASDPGLFSEVEPRAEKRDDGFERFWKSYPKKVGKPAARKAWGKAVTRAPAELIIERAAQYAAWLANAAPGEFRPTPKHPQGWLNDDRWEDEVLNQQPAARRPPSRPQWGEVVQ